MRVYVDENPPIEYQISAYGSIETPFRLTRPVSMTRTGKLGPTPPPASDSIWMQRQCSLGCISCRSRCAEAHGLLRSPRSCAFGQEVMSVRDFSRPHGRPIVFLRNEL